MCLLFGETVSFAKFNLSVPIRNNIQKKRRTNSDSSDDNGDEVGYRFRKF